MAHQQQHEKSDLGFLRPVKTANCRLKRKKKGEKNTRKNTHEKNTNDRLTDINTDPDTICTEGEIILNNKMIRVADLHSCQPLLGVNLSPEFVNLYFPYAVRGRLFFRWWQRHFEFQPARVAVEWNNVVRNTHTRLQISLPTRFLSLLH